MTDREAFHSQAVEILRQEVPEDLEWLPWNGMPAMRWSGDGAPVDGRIPRGWLVMAARRGDPHPDAEMRLQAALFDRRDAAVLGRWLLQAWIGHDTAETELTPARIAELREIAGRAAEMAQRFGRGGSDPEERFQQLLRQEENRPSPSALPHLGLLAVVAACADDTAAADVERYVERWQDERPEQCQALRRTVAAR